MHGGLDKAAAKLYNEYCLKITKKIGESDEKFKIRRKNELSEKFDKIESGKFRLFFETPDGKRCPMSPKKFCQEILENMNHL
jgi:hypothetical protein